jgi:hypothetical protein
MYSKFFVSTFLILSLANYGLGISKSDFFNTGGAELPAQDDGAISVALNVSFKFFNGESSTIHVGHNGVLSFNQGKAHASVHHCKAFKYITSLPSLIAVTAFTPTCEGLHQAAKVIAIHE